MPMLTLIRGLPGSGKSTLASLLVDNFFNSVHYEADMFFVDKDGTYHYDKTKIQEAHAWCLEQTKKALEREADVIVSNTFTQMWQMEPYFQLQYENKCSLNIIECKGMFGSVHNVPHESMLNMHQKWEEIPPLFEI
jgi:predicted kinase